MQHLMRKAHANVQRYLGDIDEESLDDEDLFYEEVYTLAHDGAVEAGATMQEAREIAIRISSLY